MSSAPEWRTRAERDESESAREGDNVVLSARGFDDCRGVPSSNAHLTYLLLLSPTISHPEDEISTRSTFSRYQNGRQSAASAVVFITSRPLHFRAACVQFHWVCGINNSPWPQRVLTAHRILYEPWTTIPSLPHCRAQLLIWSSVRDVTRIRSLSRRCGWFFNVR